MKTCILCQQTKPFTDFYAHPKMADGLLNRCKECHKAAIRAKRKENADHYRKYDRARAKDPARVKLAKEHVARWRNEDKRRSAAHSAVARAIQSGQLVRKPCSECGREDAYAHHESYDRKLDVNWLCQPCHKKRHAEMRAAGIEP